MSEATDAYQFSNISATTAPFQLQGGMYSMSANATWSTGDIQLQALSIDGTTWLDIPDGDFAADGFFSPLYLPAGQYRIEVTTATAVYGVVANIPFE
jgi:hypothetical protein